MGLLCKANSLVVGVRAFCAWLVWKLPCKLKRAKYRTEPTRSVQIRPAMFADLKQNLIRPVSCCSCFSVDVAHHELLTRTSRWRVLFMYRTRFVREFRDKSMPGRLQYCLEPSMRGRGAALVFFYSRATTGLAGVLQGVQKRPDPARVCRG